MSHFRPHLLLLTNRISLTVNVRQALKADDSRQISMLVSNADAKTIAATAKELTSEEAVMLIERLSTTMALEPKHLSTISEWIKELVSSHLSYISSQNRTKQHLRPILELLNQRLATNADLIEMRKMTEAVLQKAGMTSSAVPVLTPTTEPMIRWETD